MSDKFPPRIYLRGQHDGMFYASIKPGYPHGEFTQEFLSLEEHQAILKPLLEALELIAIPKRADGTYNRCREACEELARSALEKFKQEAHDGEG